jgi:hypothetical protein
MIPYLIGAGIGYIIAELVNEDKIEKLKASQAQPSATAPIENPPTSEPQNEQENETDTGDGGEEKQVSFVAKSRGKKKQ